MEAQSIWDGNLIDDRSNGSSPGPDPQDFPRGPDIASSGEDNGPHIERFWIDYQFPNTPFGVRVGADLWTTDQAGLLGDDDPCLKLYGKFGDVDAYAAAVIQNEGARLGLADDNDLVYYTFGVGYNLKPHRLQLDVAYFRDRYSGARGQSAQGQKIDSVLVQPSWTGSIGKLSGLLQGMFLWGTAEGANAAGNPDFDVLSWGAVAQIEYDMGVITPFAALMFGSADDDPNDNDLNGFFTLPQREITLMFGRPQFSMLSESPAMSRRSVAPAYAPGFDAEFRKTTGSVFSDRLGRTEHRTATGVVRIDTTYSNPGTLVIPVGLKINPLKGHEIVAYYAYVGIVDSALAESIASRASGGRVTKIDESLIHEFGLTWEWQLSPNFVFSLDGYVDVPADGAKDIASVQDCGSNGVFRACDGEDLYLRGQAKFHARF